MLVIERLIQSLRYAAKHNPDVQSAPACILWPDHDHQWEAIIPRLQEELPELLVLGKYNPEKRIGPAIWLRCAIAGKTDIKLPADRPPIIYLPGASRQDLRAIESCPDYLKPLAELQFRGTFWSHISTKDWTILMYLRSDQGGLGLDTSQDKKTKNAMQLALPHLLDEEIDLLKDKHLDHDYFNELIIGDPVRNILQWLDQSESFRSERNDNEWKGFVEICKSQFAFHPENDGFLAGANNLAAHEGPWLPVWDRFCEAPRRYPNIPTHIRKCKAPINKISWYDSSGDYEGWPQWNEEQENKLRKELADINNQPPHAARKLIADLEKKHGSRRNLIWAELGESSLAQAMEHLSVLARITSNALAAGTLDDLTAGYRSSGWQADDAVIRALACVQKPEDLNAVKTAIQVIYHPWAEESARYLQKVVDESGYPGGTASIHKAPPYREEECILFVDGMRFDVAKRLAALLSSYGCQIEEKAVWAALPTVTATGKPAVTPVRDRICGQEENSDFEPCVADSGKSLNGNYHLKKLLVEAGWTILEGSSNGNGKGNAWCEFGNIDHEGHERGWKIAKELDGMLIEIQDRVAQLLDAGWKSIHIVTDHGWLVLPGGLPKTELPTAITQARWGRCAAIKPGASTSEIQYPWYWNPIQHFALAGGISCFREGMEYAHGGLSLQECLTIELIVSSGSSNQKSNELKNIDVTWKRLRCRIAVDGEFDGILVDIRTQPGNSKSSITMSPKRFNEDGTASVVVEDEDLIGTKAVIVLLDPNGGLMAQVDTTVGGDSE